VRDAGDGDEGVARGAGARLRRELDSEKLLFHVGLGSRPRVHTRRSYAQRLVFTARSTWDGCKARNAPLHVLSLVEDLMVVRATHRSTRRLTLTRVFCKK
jgi:hypothetical protein